MMNNQLSDSPSISCQEKQVGVIDETYICDNIRNVISFFPNEHIEVIPGIKWGNYSKLYTPAFWKLLYVYYGNSAETISHRLSTSLVEEIVACLLGGYGIPSEIGMMAFKRLREGNLIQEGVKFESIYEALSTPFLNNKGKEIYYRFYNQKSKYVYKFLNRNNLNKIPLKQDIELRNWLLTIEGIGLKTASWITRNWLQSNNVAIIDIHILRAGQLTGFFDKKTIDVFDYLKLEKQYLRFCKALDVLPSNLDAIIWGFMKKNTKLVLKTIHS